MSDDGFSDSPSVHNTRPRPARQPVPGEEVWRVQLEDGRIQTCELRDKSRVGAGWDLAILEDGELLFSRQCVNEVTARDVADMAKRDQLRCGCREIEKAASDDCG